MRVNRQRRTSLFQQNALAESSALFTSDVAINVPDWSNLDLETFPALHPPPHAHGSEHS